MKIQLFAATGARYPRGRMVVSSASARERSTLSSFVSRRMVVRKMVPSKLAPSIFGVPEIRRAQIGAIPVCLLRAGTEKFRAASLRFGQVRAVQMGFREVRFAQIGAHQLGLAQVGGAKLRLAKIGAFQICALQIGVRQIGFVQIRARKISAGKLRTHAAFAAAHEFRMRRQDVGKLLTVDSDLLRFAKPATSTK